MPSFEAFLPKRRGTKPQSGSSIKRSPVDALQAFLYVSPLSWQFQ
jgi:hypothetical protein